MPLNVSQQPLRAICGSQNIENVTKINKLYIIINTVTFSLSLILAPVKAKSYIYIRKNLTWFNIQSRSKQASHMTVILPCWWSLEYTNCILSRGVRHFFLTKKNWFPGYDTKPHLVVRLQFWRTEECGVCLHCHYTQIHSDPKC